jgi:hypothetical protein
VSAVSDQAAGFPFVVSVHDVAPATAEQVATWVSDLDARAKATLTRPKARSPRGTASRHCRQSPVYRSNADRPPNIDRKHCLAWGCNNLMCG